MCDESDAVDHVACNEFCGKLVELVYMYTMKDVLRGDETGLFYKLLPNKTLTIKERRAQT